MQTTNLKSFWSTQAPLDLFLKSCNRLSTEIQKNWTQDPGTMPYLTWSSLRQKLTVSSYFRFTFDKGVS